MLVLPVQVDEPLSDRLELRQERGAAVHERAPLPFEMDLAPEEEASFLGLPPQIREGLEEIGAAGQVEDRLDRSARLAGAKPGRVGAVAEQ